jgi:hypothetical protein
MNGAESIVVSGGYKDDNDFGDVIVYTGHGGQDGKGLPTEGAVAVSRTTTATASTSTPFEAAALYPL